ncbi:MAG TPA: LPXTG cell wall anchor domain-containing protein [Ilumatobacteraceae bacterium]|nr:LPXTG cell wall anchor domain-containing protein [Ilumatobacteraceae bacterium]
MKARTVGPALMIVLGGAMMFMPSSTYVGAGSSTVTDPCDSLPSDNVAGLVAGPPTTDCCIVGGPGIIDPCVVDTIDTIVDTAPETTDTAGSGGQIPATGASSNTWLVVLIGGALVVGGSGLLVAGRRKPNETSN